ncbi:DUF2877 domain-containing protein (plasmid) [Photobacterium sp. DA100]|uniref:DUF2877 domain-containing protein n=1 Tax=Photobacterium sp. DA100 TaxID=3027472 RepID=UPI002478A06E|nr:DUF2877 domain-containing protein [Photobacterium sp. DA100]WEM44610.1 DUF2877 domain-containing protein [Photobacterium sp. DA100]
MVHEALAYSLSAPSRPGSLRFAGGGSKAINFLTEDHKVLTLHRSDAGMSPSGWAVSPQMFSHLSQLVPDARTIRLVSNGMIVNHFHLRKGENGVWLKARDVSSISLEQLTDYLSKQTKETGLYGSLSTIAKAGDKKPFESILSQVYRWFDGQPPCWEGVIGAGPGLTPSHDDMLVGMLACAYSSPNLREKAHSLLPSTLDLDYWTTSVSAGYLEQARNGYFSISLLDLIHSSPEDFNFYASRLLCHGHYSGADTLLGMWLFLNVKNKIINTI